MANTKMTQINKKFLTYKMTQINKKFLTYKMTQINKKFLTYKVSGLRYKVKNDKFVYSKPILMKINGVKIHLKKMSWKKVLNYILKVNEYTEYKKPLSASSTYKIIKRMTKINKLRVFLVIEYNYPKYSEDDDEDYVYEEEKEDEEDEEDDDYDYDDI